MIRPARVGDAEAIEHVRVRAWEAAFRKIASDEAYEQASSREQVERTRAYLADLPPRHVFVVAETEGAITGFARAGPPRDEDVDPETVGELYTLYVDPDWWRRGVGKALAAVALERLGREGYAAAIVWSFEATALSRAFYDATGWRLDGARSVFGGATTVRYRRTLSAR